MANVLGGQAFFVLLMGLGLWATVASSRELQKLSMKERHEQWMSLHGRAYKDEAEKARRFGVFKTNVDFIKSFNRAGNKSYTLSINEFTDMTNEEFQASRTGYKWSPVMPSKRTSFKYANVNSVPSSMDWRQKEAVTPVKNQHQCGCCWAFSAVAAVEGITQLKTGKLISLSEQELVDCDTSTGDQGCEGGWMDNAFEFIIQNKGLATESDYPYEGVDSSCKTSKAASPAASITGYEDVPANDEASLLNAAANQPISVVIDASGMAFQSYSGGIFTGYCGTNLNHAVTVVGYGTTTDGTKYWLVKNSWGEGWGERGYIRMEKDVAATEGLCGIAMRASYPTA